MRVLSMATVLAVMVTAACSVMEKQGSEASPALYKVAKGALVEVDAPFPARATVSFRNGALLGYVYLDPWSIKCDMHFKGSSSGEITSGRYEVASVRQQELSMGDDDFLMTTTLVLNTLSGPGADTIQCSQRGSYYELVSPVQPITVQQFKHAVGKHLTLTLQEN